MDIQLAKTFLEIMSAGSLLEAAKRLHVTQTTVTARVKTLEMELGCRLFIRNRSGASLTQEGERFVEYAKKLVLTWERARLDLAQPKDAVQPVRVGVENSLWSPLMVQTISYLHCHNPSLAIESRVDTEGNLVNQLDQGELDAVVLHRPNYHSRFHVELLMEEKLIHIRHATQPQPDLFVDWGDAFKAQYDAALPQPRQQSFTTNFGPLALRVLLASGGNGYFRARVVEGHLKKGELVRVVGAPEFSYPVYLLMGGQPVFRELQVFIDALKHQTTELEY